MLLRAFLACGLLYPFFRLAHVLVYSKIRTNIGIKKAWSQGVDPLQPAWMISLRRLACRVVNGWGLTEVRAWHCDKPQDALVNLMVHDPVCHCIPGQKSSEHAVQVPINMVSPGNDWHFFGRLASACNIRMSYIF